MADLLPVHGLLNGTTILHYFRTSDVYGLTGGVGAKAKIKKIADADLTGKEEIIPVKELLRTGALLRIGIRYKTPSNKKKSAKVLVSNASISGLFSDTGTDKLEGLNYEIAGASRGVISGIGLPRRAQTY